MGVDEAIKAADSLLPGVPVDEGPDPRWQAIVAVGEHLESDPEAVWEFVRRWGGHPQEDLRDAVSTCLLEHLLEFDFATYFAKSETLALADPLFADMVTSCWPSERSLSPGDAERFARLVGRLRQARVAIEPRHASIRSRRAASRGPASGGV